MVNPHGRLALLLGTCLAVYADPATARPRYEATIVRTTFGMPHISATDFGGLGFGAAYTAAQDNFCVIAENYVTVAGERSRYFGADNISNSALPAKNVDSDVYYRAVPDLRLLRAAFRRTSADHRAMVDGWVAGYNRFVRDRRSALPAACAGRPWVRPISRDDVLRSLHGFYNLTASTLMVPQIATATPPGGNPARAERAAFNPEETPSSNAWAFGGEATVNGRGLLVGNPHFPWTGANRFYQLHLTIPGKFDVAGAGVLTMPFVSIGFNRSIAWSHTVDTAAHMTIFDLKLAPGDATSYLVDGKREAMTRRELTIESKDGPPIKRTIHFSRYGPVFSMPAIGFGWTAERAFAVKDASGENLRAGETWLAIGRSRDVSEIRDALGQTLGLPFMNTVAADRSGNALYADITAVPNVSAAQLAKCGSIRDARRLLAQKLYILDGSRAECDWAVTPGTRQPGLMPASAMATLVRRDFVQNSNDSPWLTNPAAPIRDMEPLVGEVLPQSLRTRSGILEINRALAAGKMDHERAMRTILANKVLAAELALQPMLRLCRRPAAPAAACAALAKWDGKAEVTSRGAVLFFDFWTQVENRPDLWTVGFDARDPVNTPRGLAVEGKAGDALLAALSQAAEALRARGVPLDAPLGDVQVATRGDERIPISGGGFYTGTLNMMISIPTPYGLEARHGTSYLQIVGFDDRGPVAQAMLGYSQSTDPESSHFADQTRLYSTKELHPVPFTDEEIAARRLGPPVRIRD